MSSKNKNKKKSTNVKNKKNVETKSTKVNGGLIALIAGAVCVVLAIVIIALSGNKEPVEQPNLVTNAATPTKYDAKAYLIDSWRQDFEDGTKKYYVTLAMHSDDYYAELSAENIRYQSEGKYEALTDVFDNAAITIYNVNGTTAGICSYAKIETDELIDTKKLYVQMAGPSEFDADALTKDAYVEKYGTDDGWVSKMTSISSLSVPNDVLAVMQTDIDHGVRAMTLSSRVQYYFEMSPDGLITDGDTMFTTIKIDALSDYDIDEMANVLASYGYVANIDGEEFVSCELDERLEIFCQVNDNGLMLGFKTVDGSDISEYDGEIPDAIFHEDQTANYFVIN